MRIAVAVFVVFGLTPIAPAQPLQLTLHDAVQMAVRNATAPALARAADERAEANIVSARAGLLPELEARLIRYNQSINLQTFGFSLPGLPPIVGPFNVTDAQVTAAMRLFDLSALRQYQAARSAASGTKYATEEAEDDAAAAAARLYVLLRRAETEIATREANVALFEELRRVAQDQLDAGTGIRLDVARAEAQLGRERQTLLVARNSRETTRLALLHVIGANQAQEVVLTESLPQPAAVPDADAALATAFTNRADLKQYAALHRAAQLAVDAARDARLPTLGFDFLGDYSGNRSTDLLWSRRFGAAIDVPVFTGGRIEAGIATAKAQEHEVAAREEETKRQVEEDVRRSILSLTNAITREQVAADNVRVAEEALNVARDRYANGVGTNLEVAQAQDAYRQAREDQVAAQADASLATIDLSRATGSVRTLTGTK